jgi:hypothetical protein
MSISAPFDRGDFVIAAAPPPILANKFLFLNIQKSLNFLALVLLRSSASDVFIAITGI